MSSQPTYPGVYIQELPSGTRTITPVATSITAFVGTAQRGPTDHVGPQLIQTWGDFQRIFGGLWKSSNMSYAVNQFYMHGGQQAIIVRVSNGTPAIFDAITPITWKLQAASPGAWGAELVDSTVQNGITLDTNIDPTMLLADPTLFNLTIADNRSDGTVVNEKFLNLSTNSTSPRYAPMVLAEDSQLVSVVNGLNGITQPGTAPLAKNTSTGFTVEAGSATDGADVTATNLTTAPYGIYSLEKADLFNMLCIPPYNASGVDSSSGELFTTVYQTALSYFTNYNKRAILLVDPPSDWNSVTAAVSGFPTLTTLPRDKNAAIYFPRIQLADPLNKGRPREFVPCGAVAGIIAQTDAQRGVWKAPAGIEATFSGVEDLTNGGAQIRMSDLENGELNPLGVNCLRIKPVIGPVVWGARTLRGADQLADQWKYLPIRRTAEFIEESLYRGTQWVVFEPNDQPLWKSIRLNVGAFMQELFVKGAFQGSTPSQAYLVKCDAETNPQYLIDQGIVTILVGFAPLYPAEFVIIQIQQLTAQAGG